MIVAAEAKDGEAIQEIAARAGVFDAVEVATVTELWEEYLQKGAQGSGYHFIVYREGETTLGFACFGERALTEGTYDLYWIAVSPEERRSGIGQALMRAAEEAMRQMGGRLVVVETSGTPRYEGTRRFYASVGYQAEATLRDFYRPGDDLVIFTKRLK